MRSTILNIFILGTLVSCGAAKNPDSRNSDDVKPPGNTNQAAGSTELQEKLRSQMYRFKKSEQYSYTTEAKKLQESKLPVSHRTIPNINYDIDKGAEPVTPLENPTIACGNSKTESIKARHADCFEKHPLAAFVEWSGKNQGISGEGNWQFISNSKTTEGENKIVWQDFTTGYLWGDVMSGY